MQDIITESLISEWEQFQGFIDKIQAKSDKFHLLLLKLSQNM